MRLQPISKALLFLQISNKSPSLLAALCIIIWFSCKKVILLLLSCWGMYFFTFFGRRLMKVSYKLLVPAFLAGLLLAGCGQQDVATPAEEAMESATEAAGEMTEAAGEMAEEAGEMAEEMVEEASGAGGYEPTEDERVPGVTRP